MISKYDLLLYLWFHVEMLILHPRLGNSAAQRLRKLLCASWTKFYKLLAQPQHSLALASNNVDASTKQEMATKFRGGAR